MKFQLERKHAAFESYGKLTEFYFLFYFIALQFFPHNFRPKKGDAMALFLVDSDSLRRLLFTPRDMEFREWNMEAINNINDFRIKFLQFSSKLYS